MLIVLIPQINLDGKKHIHNFRGKQNQGLFGTLIIQDNNKNRRTNLFRENNCQVFLFHDRKWTWFRLSEEHRI